MLSFYYKNSITNFISDSSNEIIGAINNENQFDSIKTQNKSWALQIPILKSALGNFQGTIFFEFSIPRMGKRIDCLIIIRNIVFVLEFKVGENLFKNSDINQVWDYALDLKNFHKPSHKAILVPVLVATEAKQSNYNILSTSHNDNLFVPIKTNKYDLKKVIESVVDFFSSTESIDANKYASGSYSPTPTIIEAAVSLYNNHNVDAITRSDAEAKNLTDTTNAISTIIRKSKELKKKSICFITGVPGAGKTLVGLKIAAEHLDKDKGDSSVYLSGNAPLVAILQEALSRDKVAMQKLKGDPITKSKAKGIVKLFIQIIHHYRDTYLIDKNAPFDHVAIFDEAQRAWNKEQTIKFMQQKKNQADFNYSEPEFLISCLDRHPDWATIICLVGGGQEINTGEAGISEWLNAIAESFPSWEVNISPNLSDNEYNAINAIKILETKCKVNLNPDLHLGVSMRSYRAENLSLFVKHLLDLKINEARAILTEIIHNYPIVLSRDLKKAKSWLKEKARGNERYGIVVSSQAQRLKPYAIDVKSPINPVNWFLDDQDDVRSSYFLEDVATEFQVQGLELDWACVTWDGDLRFLENEWRTFSFKGNSWKNIHKEERKKYLINAYRVLLTRARQGMIIVVPEGDIEDHTRKNEYYDGTFEYLKNLGIPLA
ncbi:MAG TPA: DUF2075 domain-containing protein [Flavobacteriales bacterium]|nr:DUF2075 domain-containing protein [Flavobacteriales bacterium]